MLKDLKNNYKELPKQVRSSFWFLVSSFLQKGILVISTPIITRLLSTSEYGEFNVYNSWLNIITIVVTLQLYYGVYTQGLVKFSEDRNVFSSSLQGLTLFLTLFWTIIYLSFHNFWNNIFSLTTVQMFSMLVMIWSTAVFHFWASEQRVEYKYVALVIVTLVISVAKPIVGIIFILLSKNKVTAYFLGVAVVELVGYIGFFITQMRKGKVFFSKKYWLYSLAFNIRLIPHYLSQAVLNSSDKIMIKKMIGLNEAGIYGLAYSVSQIMTLFNSALSSTLSPWIYQKIKNNRIEDISHVAYLTLYIVFAVNIALIAIAPEIIYIFAPYSYRDAIWVIPPVAMSVMFMYSYDLFAKFEFYYEKTSLIMIASVIGASLNVLLNTIFIKIYGYQAAAYTTLICYIIYAFAHYCFMKHICKKHYKQMKVYDEKILLSIYISFVLLGFLLMLTYNYPFIRYGIIVLLLICIFIKKSIIINSVKEILKINKTNKESE